MAVDDELELVLAGRQVERHLPRVGAGGLHGVQEDPLRPGADDDDLAGTLGVDDVAAELDGGFDEDAALEAGEHAFLEQLHRVLREVLVAADFAVLVACEEGLLAAGEDPSFQLSFWSFDKHFSCIALCGLG
jgi:hypothetical protein